MSRWALPCWLVVLVSALALAPLAGAQTIPGLGGLDRSGPRDEVLTLDVVGAPRSLAFDASDTGPLNDKALAKNLRAAHQHQPGELRQAMRDAARDEYYVRLPRVRGGQETSEYSLEARLRLVAAELALASDDRPMRRAALERFWAGTRDIEELTGERVMAGVKQFTAADYWGTRSQRLLAERQLVQELGGAGNLLLGHLFIDGDDLDPLATKAIARDLRAATRQTPRALAQAALDACWNEHEFRLIRVAGGQETPDVLFGASVRRVEAARALGGDPPDLVPVLESYWHMAAILERLTAERVEAGVRQFTRADEYAARDYRLEAEVWLGEARARPDKPLPLQGAMQDRFAAVDDPLGPLRFRLIRDLAHLKFQATRSNARQLHERRRQTILAEYAVRVGRVRGGQETPDVSQDASRRLLVAELALASSNRDAQLTALERYFAREWEIEILTRERIEAGIKNFTTADYYQSRFARLAAELLLAEARAEKK